ncbi:MAG: hypothetical protein HY874_08655 [Chloroflexi bacterium]|nr:hypothetical protein [Chloroflexota bacterium]
MPKGTGLVAGMVAFAVFMAALVAWAIFGGIAGKERGLVFKNLTTSEVVLRFDDGRATPLGPQAEQTLPVKPSQFPQSFHVLDTSGNELYARRFEFGEFKHYEFRVGIGETEFVTVEHPTSN